MRCRLVMLLSLVVVTALVLPSVASARGATASRGPAPPPAPDPPAALGEPWTGSYVHMSPSSLKRTKARNVWVQVVGFFNSWADGAPNGTHANEFNAILEPSFSGAARLVTWAGNVGIASIRDPDHPPYTLTFYWNGRAKVRLTPGFGRKVIKVRFETVGLNDRFDPFHPFSPTYQTKVTRVR